MNFPDSSEFPRLISRRMLILSGGAAIGTAAMYLASGENAWASDANFVIEPVTNDDVHLLSSNPFNLLSYPRQLALRLLNNGPEIPVGTNFTFSFDTRFYVLASTAIVSIGGNPTTDFILSAPKRTAAGATTWSLKVTVPIPPTVNAQEALTITLGSARSQLYPYDMLRNPETLQASFSNRRNPDFFTSRHTLNRASKNLSGGLPWGVQTSVFWNRKTWGSTDQYYISFHLRSHSTA